MPDDFKPESLGGHSEVIGKIKVLVPEVDFSDPTWGRIRGADCSLELSLGREEFVDSISFHIRGADQAASILAVIVKGLNLRAMDCSSGEFLSFDGDAVAGLQAWRAYRDRTIGA